MGVNINVNIKQISMIASGAAINGFFPSIQMVSFLYTSIFLT